MSSRRTAYATNVERFFGKNNTHRGIARAITKKDKISSVATLAMLFANIVKRFYFYNFLAFEGDIQ